MTVVPCCEFHNRYCEPPAELCCYACSEIAHPLHADGSECIAPDLSGNHLPPRTSERWSRGLDD